MEKIELIVSQIEEAKNFIFVDKVSYYRMALLLLDNVSEILMNRVIQEEYSRDDIYEKLLANIKDLPKEQIEEAKKSKELKSLFSYKPVSKKQRDRINKYYDEKIKFLSIERSYLKPTVANVLSYLHRYRNEAYHREFIRRDTIRTVVLILFEIVLDLFIEFPPRCIGRSSDDDWKWFEEKYNVDNMIGEDIWTKIYKKFKKELTSDIDIRFNLISHLNHLIEDSLENLQYILDALEEIDTLETALKAAQYWIETDYDDIPLQSKAYKEYSPKFKIVNFSNWKERIPDILNCSMRITQFAEFWRLENEIEPIEKIISDVVDSIKSSIEHHSEMMRGK